MKVLVIDTEQVKPEFIPAIQGLSELNEGQAERLTHKLLRLLEQKCRVEGVTEFKTQLQPSITNTPLLITPLSSEQFSARQRVRVFVVPEQEKAEPEAGQEDKPDA